MIFPANCGPLSVKKYLGIPYGINKIYTNTDELGYAVVLEDLAALVTLEYISVMTTIYCLPEVVFGRPKTSV